MTFIRKLISGLDPLQTDTHEIVICPGICAGNNGQMMDFPTGGTISLKRVGPWGVDRALQVGWQHLYAIQKWPDWFGCDEAMILSPSQLGGGVILPDGYNRLRKLPGAWYVKGSSAGMRQQVCENWPRSARFRYQNTAETELPLINEADFKRFGLLDYMPENARYAELDISAESTGLAGYAWVKTPGMDDLPITVAAGGKEQTRRIIAVSSSGSVPPVAIECRTSASVNLRIRVVGFAIFETY